VTSKFARFENILNPVDNNAWEILQETVYKTRISDLELSTTPLPLTNGCRNDDMIQLGPPSFQSLFQFNQITDAYSFTDSLAIFLTCCNQVDLNLVNLGATVEVG